MNTPICQYFVCIAFILNVAGFLFYSTSGFGNPPRLPPQFGVEEEGGFAIPKDTIFILSAYPIGFNKHPYK
jgi:hypothetical protein